MFEWIGGLFGLGQNGGFFIFLFIVLCIVGYISSDLDDFSEVQKAGNISIIRCFNLGLLNFDSSLNLNGSKDKMAIIRI